MTAAFENLAETILMMELDEEIAAVWQVALNGEAEWLARRVLAFDMSREAVIREINKPPQTLKEKAFQTILKNRTFHGGILAAGAGFVKNGEAGSRLYTHHQLNHDALFEACAGLKGDFIMTYDDAAEVRELAQRHGFQAKPVAMKNTHHAELTELVIGRDLSWMSTFRQAPSPPCQEQ